MAIADSKALVKELITTVLVEEEILVEREDDEKGPTDGGIHPVEVQLWEVELKARLKQQRLEFEHTIQLKQIELLATKAAPEVDALTIKSGHDPPPSTEFDLGRLVSPFKEKEVEVYSTMSGMPRR